MDRQYDFAALEALLKKRSFKALREALLELNEVDIAEFLGLLNGEEAVLAFRTLPKGVAADVFAELEPEMQQLIVAAATDAELAVIVEDLYVDDAVDMLCLLYTSWRKTPVSALRISPRWWRAHPRKWRSRSTRTSRPTSSTATRH